MIGTKKRVLVGMSGGIDSTATCLMLREQGYELVGPDDVDERETFRGTISEKDSMFTKSFVGKKCTFAREIVRGVYLCCP